MEPTLPAPNGSPEMGPSLPRVPEAAPRAPEHAPDTEQRAERPAPQEQRTGSGAGDNTPPPMPVVPVPTSPTTTVQDDTAVHDASNPAVAADEDLIEKEWVEKAKKIISDTKHDPYQQERAVRRLQADYLQKRYGKTIKVPEE